MFAKEDTMDLTLTISGSCCDFALHPVDAPTAERINALGSAIYKTSSLEWWRADTDNSCGMRFDADALVEVSFDGARMPFEAGRIAQAATTLRRRGSLGSEHFLCLLGYEDEACSRTWTWRGVTVYDPEKFSFLVQRWDRILGMRDYLVVDEVFYDGRPADRTSWGESRGYSFRDPLVIDLDAFGDGQPQAATHAA
jgi:isocitrate lyase